MTDPKALAEAWTAKIEMESFDPWAFDKTTGRYRGMFDREECASFLADRITALINDILHAEKEASDAPSPKS